MLVAQLKILNLVELGETRRNTGLNRAVRGIDARRMNEWSPRRNARDSKGPIESGQPVPDTQAIRQEKARAL